MQLRTTHSLSIQPRSALLLHALPRSLHAAIRATPRPLPEEAIWRVLLHITLALHHMHARQAGPARIILLGCVQ